LLDEAAPIFEIKFSTNFMSLGDAVKWLAIAIAPHDNDINGPTRTPIAGNVDSKFSSLLFPLDQEITVTLFVTIFNPIDD
jgi:hypothetical protein